MKHLTAKAATPTGSFPSLRLLLLALLVVGLVEVVAREGLGEIQLDQAII